MLRGRGARGRRRRGGGRRRRWIEWGCSTGRRRTRVCWAGPTYTRNPKPEIRDPKPETRNPEPETQNPDANANVNPKLLTLDPNASLM